MVNGETVKVKLNLHIDTHKTHTGELPLGGVGLGVNGGNAVKLTGGDAVELIGGAAVVVLKNMQKVRDDSN